jgi:hypothetical protein
VTSKNVVYLTQKSENLRRTRYELNIKNTVLLQQMAQLRQDYKDAKRSGDKDKVAAIRAQMEQLDVDKKYHDLDREAAEHTLLDDPESVEWAKGAHLDIKQEMAKEVTAEWIEKRATVRAAISTLMATVEELGMLAAKGDRLKAQISYVQEITGLTNMVYIQNPADVDIPDVRRHKGVIFPDLKEIAAAYLRGKAKGVN